MQGYKPGAAKSADEYAKLDAEDESLARWKASLGLGAASSADTSGPKVCYWCSLLDNQFILRDRSLFSLSNLYLELFLLENLSCSISAIRPVLRRSRRILLLSKRGLNTSESTTFLEDHWLILV